MNRVFLSLEDGAIFEGYSVSDAPDTAGLLSFYTGVVGYQEVITDPANLGKIIVFTYPLIGNYGVNPQDAESSAPKVSGIITKEYPPYYSNFRATGNLADYLSPHGVAFGTGFDTRAILLYMRDNGEMRAAVSTEKKSAEEVIRLCESLDIPDYRPENSPLACAQARPRATAHVLDFGAGKSFYKQIAELGIDACATLEKADLVIVSDAPYYLVESDTAIGMIRGLIGHKPVIGFGHGSAMTAKACDLLVKRAAFGDHGVNVPVKSAAGGRNEITVQNHNYEVEPSGNAESIFTNLHDGSCEGFVCRSSKAAGVNFMPSSEWLGVLLKSVEVE